MMGLFDEFKQELPPFEDYLDRVFHHKRMKLVEHRQPQVCDSGCPLRSSTQAALQTITQVRERCY